MKKFYLVALFALICNLASAQMERTTYRGAFAPAAAMWTDTWTNWNPQAEAYPDKAPATTDVSPANSNVVNVTANVTTNTTWYATKTYKLKNIIYVSNNVTLTIQPGTVIKGESGSALVITRGAKINATGTAALPIVFTSAKTSGNRAFSDWGGVVLLGKAGFNLNSGVNYIEGITSSVNTQYGGGTSPIDNDNSGTLKYVRIEYAGYVFSPNNELNGLTFGAVGNGTTVDYVQVSYCGDDSFEWFGGSVNCKHLVAYRGLDDDFDTDNGYKGFVQFALGVRDPNIADNPSVSNSEGFESDNNANTTEAATGYDNTSAIFTNITLLGPSKRQATVASGYSRALRLRRSTELKIYNSVFLDFKNNYVGLTDDQTIGKYYSGKLKLKNNIFAGFYGTDFTNFPKGINPVSKTGTTNTAVAGGLPSGTVFNLSDKMVADGNIAQASSDGILTTPYNTADYTSYAGMDYRPGTGTLAASGADFSDASLTPYLPVDSSTPTVSNRNYCVGDVATPLTAVMSSTGVSLKWYTAAIGGTAYLVALTPATTLAGVKTYYVSQIKTDGQESNRVAITVTVSAKPTEVISVISGTGPVGSSSAVSVGPYVGTSSTFTYSVTSFVDTSLTYLWTVPNGVNIVAGQGTNVITVNYLDVAPGAGVIGSINVQAVNAAGCKTLAKTLAISKALPVAPTGIKMTNAALPVSTTTGLPTAITSYAKYMGTTTTLTLTASASATATSYVWELPAGVNLAANGVAGTSFVRYFTAIPFDAPLETEPSPAVGTKYWKVVYQPYTYNVNGVSTVVTTSTATQYIKGGSTYGATTSQAYAPYGTVVTSDKNAILVNFSGVTNPATTALYIGVKSKNGVGVSVTSNAANVDVVANATTIPGLFDNTYTEVYNAPVPTTINATSVITATGYVAKSARLMKLTAALPAAIISTVGQFTGLCTQSGTVTYNYTISPSALASSYLITAPVGSVVTSVSNPSNATNVLSTSDLTFTVLYPTNFSSLSSKTLVITAVNGIGNSVDKVYTLYNNVSTITVVTGSAGITTFTRCATQTFTVPTIVGAVDYVWTPANGAVIVSGQGTRTVEVSFAGVANTVTSNLLKVVAKNACNVSSSVKTITLASTDCPQIAAKSTQEAPVVNVTEVYPNPTVGNFNVQLVSSKSTDVIMTVYSFDGTVVSTKNINLSEGNNAIDADLSSQRNGIYIVKINNPSTGEVIINKVVKQ